jgi:glycosyltransferase involved in cell wall biosynthesis
METAPQNLIIALVIPAYQPDQTLVDVVLRVLDGSRGLKCQIPIIIINDGSSSETQPIFDKVQSFPGVTVLRHAINIGKGAALKTAFNFGLVAFGQNLRGVVTADADGQHLPADIFKVIDCLSHSGDALILGIRAFDVSMPIRSRFGNSLTKVVFHLFTRRSLQDTQTGLRGIPSTILKRALKIPSQGYDFELEMLVSEAERGTRFVQIPIETVYEPGNPSSHFNPLIDSAKIYYVFLRYSVLAIIAAMLDYAIFLLCLMMSNNIFASVLVGRVLTGYFYFRAARKRVFRSVGNPIPQAIKFILLVTGSMCASYGLLTVQVILLHVPTPLAKLTAELVLFLANFAVQRLFVFQSNTDRDTP